MNTVCFSHFYALSRFPVHLGWTGTATFADFRDFLCQTEGADVFQLGVYFMNI